MKQPLINVTPTTSAERKAWRGLAPAKRRPESIYPTDPVYDALVREENRDLRRDPLASRRRGL